MKYIFSINYKGKEIALTDELNEKIMDILFSKNDKQSYEEENECKEV